MTSSYKFAYEDDRVSRVQLSSCLTFHVSEGFNEQRSAGNPCIPIDSVEFVCPASSRWSDPYTLIAKTLSCRKRIIVWLEFSSEIAKRGRSNELWVDQLIVAACPFGSSETVRAYSP